jgi:ubiquinone/menaquinone biosynthesis C-methylase UbiE
LPPAATRLYSGTTSMTNLVDQPEDIPYGNDWDNPADVALWTEAADQIRPWRSRIRDFIADQVAALRPGARVLELGSGPGFLAERVLERCPQLGCYMLLDFSEPMLALSRERLARFPAAAFVPASFKSAEWVESVEGPFDCVVSMQAVHELRHKRHAVRLYEQVHRILVANGRVLICDHLPFDDTPKSIALYMTEEEQTRVLSSAGFVNVRTALSMNGLLVYACEKAG